MKAVLDKILHRSKQAAPIKIDNIEPPSRVTKIVTPGNSLITGRVIVFYFDDTSLQMAAVSHFGNQRKILNITSVSLPVATGTEDRSELTISDAISGFINKFATRGTRFVLSVSGVETAYRVFFMPVMKRDELRKAVNFELRNQIPFPSDTCYFDHRPLLKVISEDGQRYRVAILAATKVYIDNLLSRFIDQNINIDHIYLAQDSLGQFLKELPGFSETENYTLAHLKRNSTELSFYRGSSLELNTVVSTGTSMLQSLDDTNIEYFTETVIGEISIALDFYTGQFSRNDSNKIFLYGVIPSIDLLIDKLNNRDTFQFAAFPVASLPLLFRSQAPKPKTEQLLACLPVLATAYCRANLASLLPQQIREKLKRKSLASYSKAILIALSISLLLGWQGMMARSEVYENQLAEEQRKVEIFESSNYFHTYKLLKQQIANDRAYLNQIKKEPSYLNLCLKMISRLTPGEISLYHLDFDKSYEEYNLVLHGVVKSSDIPPEVILAEYAESLSSSPLFDQVQIVRHVKSSVKDHFELDFTIRTKAII